MKITNMKNLFNFIQHIKVKKYHCDNKNTHTEKVLKHKFEAKP